MQFCLINICPKLHHRHWQKLRVTLPCKLWCMFENNFTSSMLARA